MHVFSGDEISIDLSVYLSVLFYLTQLAIKHQVEKVLSVSHCVMQLQIYNNDGHNVCMCLFERKRERETCYLPAQSCTSHTHQTLADLVDSPEICIGYILS